MNIDDDDLEDWADDVFNDALGGVKCQVSGGGGVNHG